MWRAFVVLILILIYTFSPLQVKGSSITSNGSKLDVIFFDVGQGDSTLLVLPNGKSILVDGGPSEAGEALVKKLANLGIKKLDLVIATHPDQDHIGGLINVFQKIPIEKILDSGKVYDSKTYKRYRQIVTEKKIPLQKAKAGKHIILDSSVSMKIFNDARQKEENNEASIVMKLTYKKADFLLTGDADVFVEEQMLAKKYNVQAEVLKVGHHGSYTSTSPRFLEKVGPLFAVISYEQHNDHGHPHKVVLDRLAEQKVQVYTTADYGDVTVQTDGTYLAIEENQPILLP